jgi:hypothetical protein
MSTQESGQSTPSKAAEGNDPAPPPLPRPSDVLEWAKKALVSLTSSSLILAALIAILFLLIVNFEPTQFFGWLVGPSGQVYVSSPGVYTRERLVNDRNDQDFWLREQLRKLDSSEIGFAAITRTDLHLKVAAGSGAEQGSDPASGEKANEPAPQGDDTTKPPALPFVKSFAIRTAARDAIRQSILENLLDDRHDLTGNSVYGLKFDTTVFPGRFAAGGRAFVRISIAPGQSELFAEEAKPDRDFPELPFHLRSYFKSDYSDIANNPANPNYNSFNLYSQWRSNVRWRLNSHLTQIAETKCQCRNSLATGTGGLCASPLPDWRQDVISTVNTILAIDGAILQKDPVERDANGAPKDPKVKGFNTGVTLPAPWNEFLIISVYTPTASDCSNLPVFNVDGVSDTIFVRPKNGTSNEYRLVDEINEKEGAYVFAGLGRPRYRNIPSIARYVRGIEKLVKYCVDESKQDTCAEYVTVPSGYFNFIEKVIKPDMYAYSLFPRLEATSVLNAQETSRSLTYSGDKTAGAPVVGVESADSVNEASLEPTAVGFTDSHSERTVDLGWIIDVGRNGQPFQRSQFALISVPAWTSRLTVTVRTGWLTSSSAEWSAAPYSYTVPIPPDYEAFDSFIGGQEAMRRPQINDELMDDQFLVACRKAAILIPGLRLWRSAMVTVGSERADRITVLPNMRGIIAEFTKLGWAAKEHLATLRVWTSEGVDTQPNKIHIIAGDPAECSDGPPTAPKPKDAGQ